MHQNRGFHKSQIWRQLRSRRSLGMRIGEGRTPPKGTQGNFARFVKGDAFGFQERSLEVVRSVAQRRMGNLSFGIHHPMPGNIGHCRNSVQGIAHQTCFSCQTCQLCDLSVGRHFPERNLPHDRVNRFVSCHDIQNLERFATILERSLHDGSGVRRESVTIYFYSTRGEYGCFSNFSRHGFELNDRWWPTSEHYFQAQKFAGTEHEDAVRQAKTPKAAAAIGRDRARPLRSDWERVKDGVMKQAVLAKFQTHADIRETLLATGNEEIVENAPSDFYWGCGKDGSGKNKLGKILMEVREILRDRGSLPVW